MIKWTHSRLFGIYSMAQVQQRIEKNRKMIEYLTSFHPFDEKQCTQARLMYKEYLKNQKTLHMVMDDTDIEKLSFNIRTQDHSRTIVKRRIIELKSKVCEVCGAQIVQILNAHHTVPRSAGGSNDIDNFSILCLNCHQIVHNSAEAKWIDRKIYDVYHAQGTLTKLIKLIDEAMPEGAQNKTQAVAIKKIKTEINHFQWELRILRKDPEFTKKDVKYRSIRKQLSKTERALNNMREGLNEPAKVRHWQVPKSEDKSFIFNSVEA